MQTLLKKFYIRIIFSACRTNFGRSSACFDTVGVFINASSIFRLVWRVISYLTIGHQSWEECRDTKRLLGPLDGIDKRGKFRSHDSFLSIVFVQFVFVKLL